jgi:hypothetical protein
MILLALFSSDLPDVHRYLNSKCHIAGLNSFEIHLKDPEYAISKGKKYSLQEFWGTEGRHKLFLQVLLDNGSHDHERSSEKRLFLDFSPGKEAIKHIRESIGFEADLFKLLDGAYYLGLIENIVIDFKKEGVNNSIPHYELSDGEQQLLMIRGLIEFLRGRETLFLLDEPDTFLHPKWQKAFIPEIDKFKAADTQFIIATHSPQILSNVKKENVFILEDGQLVQVTPHTYGRDISSILYELMGVEERVKEVQERLDNLFRLIDEENVQEAKVELEKLTELLGENDSEIVRARALINFLTD